jgi:N-acetylmuramoyl-L-alanine amidase
MAFKSIVISSGHGKIVRGASCPPPGLDEVKEARKVVDEVAGILKRRGCKVKTFHDDTSKTKGENLKTIVGFHNRQERDLDVSVHFNAFTKTEKPRGTEVLYLTQKALAAKVSKAIASVGFIDRGAKERTNLYFLNETEEPAILLEVCFCDSYSDAKIYRREFDFICGNIATALGF